MGLGLGAAAGAAAGLAGVFLTRGPDVVLERGTQLDMVLDRDLFFSDAEVNFDNAVTGRPVDVGNGPDPNRNRNNSGGVGGRRFPL
jgi:type IV secretion system protein VirB10